MRSVINQELADITMSSDFVVSRNIGSLMMSQIAENRELKDVFETLLVADGYEIYMKPAKYYLDVSSNPEIDLFSISEAVADKHEIFIGYKLSSQSGSEPVLGPIKVRDGKAVSIQLSENDQFIVLAEDMRVQ